MTDTRHAEVPAASGTAGDVDGTPGPVTVLCRSANALRHHLERTALRDAGMSWTTFDVLQIAAQHRGVEIRIAAAVLAVSKGTLGHAARILSVRGLARRTLHPADHRRTILRPTNAGYDLVGRITARIAAEEFRLLNRRSPVASRTVDVLRRVVPDE